MPKPAETAAATTQSSLGGGSHFFDSVAHFDRGPWGRNNAQVLARGGRPLVATIPSVRHP
jgi:hypothetical protein